MFKQILTVGLTAVTVVGVGLTTQVLSNNQLLADLGLVDVIERQVERAPVGIPIGVDEPTPTKANAHLNYNGETTYVDYTVDCEKKSRNEKKCVVRYYSEADSLLGINDVTVGNGYVQIDGNRWYANYSNDNMTTLQDGQGRIHTYFDNNKTGFRF